MSGWLGSGTRVARKDHKCDYCGQTIAPAQRYAWWKHVEDGGFFNGHAHLECQDAAWWDDPHGYDDGLPDPGEFQREVLEPYRIAEAQL